MEVTRKYLAFYVTTCIVFGATIFVSRSSLVDLHLKVSFVPPKNHEWVRVSIFLKNILFSKKFWKITVFESHRKVAFKIASEASYVYILSGQKLIKNAKTSQFWRVFESLKMRLNIVTRHVALHWTKSAEYAN